MARLYFIPLYLFSIASAFPNPSRISEKKDAGTLQLSTEIPNKELKAIDPVAPEVQELPNPNPTTPGARRVKIRYGKYTLPSVSDKTLMSYLTGEPGTMSTIAVNMKKPCEDCAVTSIQAGLEYANGTVANADNGGWLHHMVLVLTGRGRSDAACGYPFERIFSSGNERTLVSMIGQTGTSAAYEFKKSDTVSAQIELMNMKNIPQDVWLTMTYEYIPGQFPSDWKRLALVWLDITGCGPSFTPAPKQQKMTFANTWTSTLNGVMLGAGGHVHDGGTDVTLYQNGKPICFSEATYSKQAGVSADNSQRVEHGGHNKNTDMPHIESMSLCLNIGRIKKGDKIEIDASYDLSKHKAMKGNNDENTMVMGISLMYVALSP